MICSRCLRNLSSCQSLSTRLFSSTVPSSTSVLADPRGTPSGSHEGPPAATSKSDAQPFSTPLSPAPLTSSARGEVAGRKKAINSSVKAGTALKGLAWLKGKDAPVAKPDEEYPDWLWTLLDSQKETSKKNAGASEGDQYGGTRKQRQRARKAATKAARANPESLTPKVPLEQQSIDLPNGDGSARGAVDALGARQELTDAMRKARRKGIKEANFLKGMR